MVATINIILREKDESPERLEFLYRNQEVDEIRDFNLREYFIQSIFYVSFVVIAVFPSLFQAILVTLGRLDVKSYVFDDYTTDF